MYHLVTNVSAIQTVHQMCVKLFMIKIIDLMGRFCLDTSSKMGRKCEVHSDCESGICKTIYDKEGHVVETRCTPAGEIEPDNSFIFKDADTSKYGIIKNEYRDSLMKASGAGPLTKFIAYLVEAIVAFVKAILSILLGIWKLIFYIITQMFLGRLKGDLIFGQMFRKYTDSNGKCTGRLTVCGYLEQLLQCYYHHLEFSLLEVSMD